VVWWFVWCLGSFIGKCIVFELVCANQFELFCFIIRPSRVVYKLPNSLCVMDSVLRDLDMRLNSCLGGGDSGVLLRGDEDAAKEGGEVGGVPASSKTTYWKKILDHRSEKQNVVLPQDSETQNVVLPQASGTQYEVLFHDSMAGFVNSLKEASNGHKSKVVLNPRTITWDMFNDQSDEIKIEKMDKPTHFMGKNILFVASFHNNSVTMSQFHVIAFLCECLVESLTILLPYYSTGTMERVDIGADGIVPTANTLALLFNGLPSVGRPIRVMTYDLHTLQNRFYVTGHAVATLHTAIPLIKDIITASQEEVDGGIKAVAFPDEGAQKRFGSMFDRMNIAPDNFVICSKKRYGSDKKVVIADGNAIGKHVIIIDDQTKSGGTLIKCAKVLKQEHEGPFEADDKPPTKGKANKVSTFVTHAICTDEFWSKFLPLKAITSTQNGERIPSSSSTEIPIGVFHKVYCTDSFPIRDVMDSVKNGKNLSWNTKDDKGVITHHTAQFPNNLGQMLDEKIEILSLAPRVLEDL
jgi:phosphoribosylpyrophosphate synthetase